MPYSDAIPMVSIITHAFSPSLKHSQSLDLECSRIKFSFNSYDVHMQVFIWAPRRLHHGQAGTTCGPQKMIPKDLTHEVQGWIIVLISQMFSRFFRKCIINETFYNTSAIPSFLLIIINAFSSRIFEHLLTMVQPS